MKAIFFGLLAVFVLVVVTLLRFWGDELIKKDEQEGTIWRSLSFIVGVVFFVGFIIGLL